jgi:hypothetical protein
VDLPRRQSRLTLEGKSTVDGHGSGSEPPPRRGGRWGTRPLVTLIKVVLAGVGGVYLTTDSLVVTIVAAAMAVIIVALVLVTQD